MLRRVIPLLLLALLLLPVGTASAAGGSKEGLLITPIRQFLPVDAGKKVNSSFTVENISGKPLAVSFSVQQFSVTNYSYTYTFSRPANDWLHLSLPGASLQPRQSLKVPYELDVPAGSTPGGYYYTLFASANLAPQGIDSTVQTTDLLYLTVNGKLTRTSHLVRSSIQRLSFGRSIPYQLEPINTGNVYFFAYTSGKLRGLTAKEPATPDAHLLLPGKVRAIQGSIASPILPGIYRATFGYKTDAGQSVSQSRWVVYIPPWSIAFLLAALLIAGKLFTRRRRSKPEDTNS